MTQENHRPRRLPSQRGRVPRGLDPLVMYRRGLITWQELLAEQPALAGTRYAKLTEALFGVRDAHHAVEQLIHQRLPVGTAELRIRSALTDYDGYETAEDLVLHALADDEYADADGSVPCHSGGDADECPRCGWKGEH